MKAPFPTLTRRRFVSAAAASVAFTKLSPALTAAAPPKQFRLWAIGDAHIETDLKRRRESLADAIRQSEQGFDWDIALNVGDFSGNQGPPEDDEGRELVRQFGALTKHRREDFYDLAGETNYIYFIPAVTRTMAGAYSVTVSNSLGTLTSTNAQLRILNTQKLKSPARLANGTFQLTFSDSDGTALTAGDVTNFIVQASTNLASATNWVGITNGFTFTNGAIRFLDTNAPALPRRFYRVISK